MERIAAGENAHQKRHIQFFKPRRTQKRFKQCRNAGNKIRTFFPEQIGISIDAEFRHKNTASAADQSGMDPNAQTEAVENRHHGEHTAPTDGRITTGGNCLQSKCIEVIAGKADAFCRSGCSAGIQDACTVGINTVVFGKKAGCVFQRIHPKKVASVFGQLWNLFALRQRISDFHQRT